MIKKRFKGIRQTKDRAPYLQCFVCKRVVKGELREGSLVMTGHDPDLGEPTDVESKLCFGLQLPNLAIPQQIPMM